jgi:hypothetical protein
MEENFKADLDRLIELFKKLRDKDVFETMMKDKEQLDNLNMVIDNYDMIKDNIPEDVAKMLGAPIRKLILMLTEQLKDELNVLDNNLEQSNITESIENKENELELIDKILGEGNLSDEDINNLLDRRNELK